MEFCQVLGDSYYHSGDHENGYKFYDKSLKILPDNAYILNNYAYYLSLDGIELDKAEAMIQRALKMFPNQSSYLDTYGWILFKKKDYLSALNKVNMAIANGGEKNPVMLEHKGDVLYFLDKKQEAIDLWKQAKELGSESETIDEKISTEKYVE